MSGKIKVLYIDDEINNLNSFKASYRFDYNILIANNTTEALGLLEQHPDITVILCDQRMPDKTGVEFFESIHSQHPNPIRILITGYTDIESVISAINRGHIFRYIRKPWNDADIKSAIDEAHRFYMTTSMLSVKNIELQKAYDELDKFAYSVTHDLRGPILSIQGAVDLARQIDDIQEIRSILDLVDKTTSKLNGLIENIHDYYRLKRGQLQITNIDFKALLDEIGDLHEIHEKMHGVRFTSVIEQNEPFRSDAMSIKIILNNLLSNAFKYQRKENPEKFVSLEIFVNQGMATIFVRDNGIGIQENYISNIFDMFYRATSEEFGSGFGLYNVKDALSKLNGTIEVETNAGQGTSFKVTIGSK
jgi:signal transduction histidine kinase